MLFFKFDNQCSIKYNYYRIKFKLFKLKERLSIEKVCMNKKVVFKILGIFFMVVGIIGIFLPVFPTTPFILLSAYLFFNSSPKLFMLSMNFINIFYVKLVMFLVFLAVTVHILSFRNLTDEEKKQSKVSYNKRFRNKSKCK